MLQRRCFSIASAVARHHNSTSLTWNLVDPRLLLKRQFPATHRIRCGHDEVFIAGTPTDMRKLRSRHVNAYKILSKEEREDTNASVSSFHSTDFGDVWWSHAKFFSLPHDCVFVQGAAGSGKTTTMLTCGATRHKYRYDLVVYLPFVESESIVSNTVARIREAIHATHPHLITVLEGYQDAASPFIVRVCIDDVPDNEETLFDIFGVAGALRETLQWGRSVNVCTYAAGEGCVDILDSRDRDYQLGMEFLTLAAQESDYFSSLCRMFWEQVKKEDCYKNTSFLERLQQGLSEKSDPLEDCEALVTLIDECAALGHTKRRAWCVQRLVFATVESRSDFKSFTATKRHMTWIMNMCVRVAHAIVSEPTTNGMDGAMIREKVSRRVKVRLDPGTEDALKQ